MEQGELPRSKFIRGLLRGPVIRSGGLMTTTGISYERYISSTYLVSKKGAVQTKLPFHHIVIPLASYEEWLRLGAIEIVQTQRSVCARYSKPKRAHYAVCGG
jgi:hypothetical protein